MKTRTKGIVMFLFLGGIMVTSGVLIAVPSKIPDELQPTPATVTGTPADNFPDAQRKQFCSTGEAKSGRYVAEYRIPTACTQPLAIKVDPAGTVWFAQTNTGKIASFDPVAATFTEFENPAWPEGARSMMWGMDYAPDNSMWYTDEAHDAIWRFSIEDEKYSRIAYSEGDAFPQRIAVAGASLIINDFAGAKISFIDQIVNAGDSSQIVSVPSPLQGSYTSDFALDGGDIWYTNWVYGGSGVIVKFDKDGYERDGSGGVLGDYVETADLPDKARTPNGIAVDPQGNVWIADTTSSSLYSFDDETKKFTEYVTSVPALSSYGNATGIILDPVSRPYWLETNGDVLVFNEHAGNRIGVLDTSTSKLVEYGIPSGNPNWADCGIALNCGPAQAFSFDIQGDKVWFTEWVENNIAVLDLSRAPPVELAFEPDSVQITSETPASAVMTVSPSTGTSEVVRFSYNSPADGIAASIEGDVMFPVDGPMTINVEISADGTVPEGAYKVLIGVDAGDAAVSKYVDVIVRSAP